MHFYEPSAKQWDRDMLDLRNRLLGAMGLIIFVTLVGIVGFLVIDPDAGLIRAFFMTAITLTTVGYGEEIAIDTDGAYIFTAVLILLGMGATLYFVSTGTAFLLEGQLGHVFRRKKMKRDLEAMTGHYIVCGSALSAFYAAEELAKVKRNVVLVASGDEAATEASFALPDVLVVAGDPTDDHVLETAGIERAGGDGALRRVGAPTEARRAHDFDAPARGTLQRAAEPGALWFVVGWPIETPSR